MNLMKNHPHSNPEPEPEQEGAGEEYDIERAIQMSLELFQAQGHAHVGGVAIQELVAEAIRPLPFSRTSATKEASTGPSAQPQDDMSANIIRDSQSAIDVETGARSDKTSSGSDTKIAGSDPGETLESRPQPEQVHMEEDQAGPDPGISRVALAGPDPKLTHEVSMRGDLYLKVKDFDDILSVINTFILKDPLSSTGTFSSMKNLEDAYAIGDQFINDKSTNDESGKLNVEAEVVSIVTVPIYQASSSVHLLSTLVIDLSPLKPASSTTQTPIFTATTTTTTTPLPPPPPLQETMPQLNQLRDLPHKTNKAVPLEASMEHAQRDEFLAKKDKSRKRCRDDQDPPPSPLDSDQNAPSSSSKQQSGPHAKQPIDDIPIPDSDNISDTRTTDVGESDGKACVSSELQREPRKDWDNAEVYIAVLPKDERELLLKQIWKVKLMKSLNLSTRISFIFSFRWKSVTRCLQIRLTELIQKVIKSGLILANLCLSVVYQGSEQALSISKMKAARYHDFGLELLVPEHMWINDVCTYDISASYGISHWWFNRQKFYIDRHTAESSRKVVITHTRILSVVRIKAYSRYGYDYLKEITLRRADHQEYYIAEKTSKTLSQ
ncbi:hypothetical protein Tco_0065572 [Tanacetum coccineum]